MLTYRPAIAALSALCLIWTSAAAQASVGTAFTYQGRLQQDGAPLSGTVDLTFTLLDAPAGGSVVSGPITLSAVPVADGLFTVDLDFGPGAFDGQARWLEIDVEGVTLSPPQPVLPAPYAMALPGLRILENATSPNLIAGHPVNDVLFDRAGVAIGGGGTADQPNIATRNYTTIAGGRGNQAGTATGGAGHFASVGGGEDNQALSGWATVSGGQGNIASAQHGTVGGGQNNEASGSNSTIGGGHDHVASATTATIAGGSRNTASGFRSTVGGGRDNLTDGDHAVVAGGLQNEATAVRATVGGGEGNLATNERTTVAGGHHNIASGRFSTVPGGRGNHAEGDYSFAAGRNARALHRGARVFTDSVSSSFESTADDQFLIRAGGGVGIGTNAPRQQLSIGDHLDLYSGSAQSPSRPSIRASSGDNLILSAIESGSLFLNHDGGSGGIRFHNGSSGSAGEMARFTVDGQLGIGTSSPSARLTIMGTGTPTGGPGTAQEVVGRFRATNTAHSAVAVDALTGRDGIVYLGEGGSAHWGIRHNSSQDRFDIRRHAGGSNVTHMAVQQDGTVWIGTPVGFSNTRLNVRASNQDAMRVSLDGIQRFRINSQGGVQIGGALEADAPTNTLLVGGRVGIGTAFLGSFSLAVEGMAAKTGGGPWASLSDARLKRDVEPMEPGTLERLLALRGYTFEFREEAFENHLAAPGRQIGLLAHEVAEVLPEWVDEDEEGYRFVTERGLTAIMVEALRELRAEKDAQLAHRDARIASLEQEIRELKDMVRRISVEKGE